MLQWIAVAMTLLVIGHVMILTIHDLRTYSGIDLRAKVVGARLLIRGLNPYYDFRHEIHIDHLRMLSDNTYSPILLILYVPLCEIGWTLQRVLYFLIDWAAMLLSYVAVARIFPKRSSGTALWIGFVLLFIADFGFRFHLERGQYYVELAFLAAVASVCLFQESSLWLNALPLALLVLLRPTYAITILGIVALRRVRHAIHVVILCGLLFVATLPFVGIGEWKSYVASVRSSEKQALNDAYASGPRLAGANPGQVIEGIDYSKSLAGPGYLADRTLVGLARGSVSPALARFVHVIAPSKLRFERLNTICLLLMFCFDLAVMHGFSRGRARGLIPIAFVFLAPLNLELFAPQHYGYCDVMILAPLLLILAAALENAELRGWVLYAALLAVGYVLPQLAFHFNEHVPLVSFSKYVVTLAVLNVVCIESAQSTLRRWRAGAVRSDEGTGAVS